MNTTIQSITKVLFSLLALFTLRTLAVCPEMEIWSDGTHFRYLIKDHHVDYIDGRVSIKQQDDIIWAVQQPKALDVFILAEDAQSYSDTHAKIQTLFNQCAPQTLVQRIFIEQISNSINEDGAVGSQKMMQCSPLACIINACKNHGIMSYNTECSHADRLFESNHEMPLNAKITREEVIKILEEHFVEVKNSIAKDGQTFLMQCFEQLKKLASQPNMDEKQFINACSEIRGYLVDAKTIHKLKQWNAIKHGFIFEGRNHIDGARRHMASLKNCLTLLGYKCIGSIGYPNIWDLPQSTAQQQIQRSQQILAHALDLRHIFQKIFTSEIAQKNYTLKQPTCDISIVQSLQGQKYLKETVAMTDDALQATVSTAATNHLTAAHINPMPAQPRPLGAQAAAIPTGVVTYAAPASTATAMEFN